MGGYGEARGTPGREFSSKRSLAMPRTPALLRATRCCGERGLALLTSRWRALQRITVSPRRIGTIVQAALVLTTIENVQLRTSC
jgi:hypothetical protein